MAVYTPVIRLPPKRKPSIIAHNNPNTQPELLEPKEFLVSDTLFLSKIPANIREADLRTLLQHCLPIEIVLDREKDSGQLRFSEPKYADRAYSLYNGFTFTNNTKLELQMYQDKRLDPEATAALLEINNLPEHYDDNQLYDLFRTFGPLNLCKCILFEGAFRGTAFVQFFYSSNSDDAVATLNNFVLEGNQLSVVPFMPSKSQQYQQQEETVDIMNLYIKNLEPHITNNELSQAFRKFGRIISARVMTNPATGQSKGYGFVSFGKSEEASAALKGMNGFMLGNRPIVVAYHEPKKVRQQTYQQNNSYYGEYNRSNSVSNPTPINSLPIDSVDGLGMNIKLKDLSIGQKPATLHAATINLPPRKNSDVTFNKLSPQFSSSPGTSTGKSLASLASGLSIQQPPPTANLGQNGRPTLRRRGSLESVMTESSANIQRLKLEEAVRNCGDYGKAVDDIVDMLLTLKRKERSLCLFNPDFLKDKVQLALEALATCIDSENEEEQDEDTDGLDTEYIMRNHSPQRKTPKPDKMTIPSSPLTKENLLQNEKGANSREIESLLKSLEGKPIHEKKQLLGDRLFPLVKSTGTKQAPKVTIRLLDTVDLHELAHIMYDTPLLKKSVEEAFKSLKQQ